jgi:hypothetical protein
MSKSIIIDVFRGKYVTAQLVDETTELTVENNVYSLAVCTPQAHTFRSSEDRRLRYFL